MQPSFSFPFRDHLEICKINDLLDLESARVVSGEKYYYLKNGAALLEMALSNWAMQKLVSKGNTYIYKYKYKDILNKI